MRDEPSALAARPSAPWRLFEQGGGPTSRGLRTGTLVAMPRVRNAKRLREGPRGRAALDGSDDQQRRRDDGQQEQVCSREGSTAAGSAQPGGALPGDRGKQAAGDTHAGARDHGSPIQGLQLERSRGDALGTGRARFGGGPTNVPTTGSRGVCRRSSTDPSETFTGGPNGRHSAGADVGGDLAIASQALIAGQQAAACRSRTGVSRRCAARDSGCPQARARAISVHIRSAGGHRRHLTAGAPNVGSCLPRWLRL
jgi:hypothetical protein